MNQTPKSFSVSSQCVTQVWSLTRFYYSDSFSQALKGQLSNDLYAKKKIHDYIALVTMPGITQSCLSGTARREAWSTRRSHPTRMLSFQQPGTVQQIAN